MIISQSHPEYPNYFLVNFDSFYSNVELQDWLIENDIKYRTRYAGIGYMWLVLGTGSKKQKHQLLLFILKWIKNE